VRPPSASIDAIEILPLDGGDDAPNAHVGDVLVVRGWAHQPGASTAFSLLIDGAAEHAIETGIPRLDVAAALDDPRAAGAGFSVSVPTVDLADGDHTVAVVVAGATPRHEIASARVRLEAPVPLANLPLGRGCIDAWTDEDGVGHPIAGTSVRVPRNHVVRIDGWIADTVGQMPAIGAFALVGDHVVELAYGFERQDVARELGEHHAYCGFSGSFPGEYAARGGTAIRLVLLASDGSTLRAAEPAVTLVGED
jgi:hypothetical protein